MCLELVYSKHYSNLSKNICFVAIQNDESSNRMARTWTEIFGGYKKQTMLSIYRIIYDAYGEAHFSVKKIVINAMNMGLP